MKHATRLFTIFAFVPLTMGCAQTQSDRSGVAPQSGQAEHQAPVDGQLGDARVEEPDPQANVVKGEPPGYPAVMATWSDPKGTPSTYRDSAIGLADGILDACKIDYKYAFFSFDSEELSDLAKDTIDKLAGCFTKGALQGHGMLIVGHTDPQGSDEYNEKLGMSRGQSVAAYLIERGMPKAKLTVRSEGEKEAIDNPIAWPADRRVDISIAE